MTSDIAWSGADCTPGVTPRQLVQSSSENDSKVRHYDLFRKPPFSKHYRWLVKQLEVLETGHELGI
ncbi:hypothetical protein [Eoetvoesiella caeni]|nr:hypothetical protein [Eoetvoesiella caeni]MCI2811377.1 hypothetical protein [Eoetvoesiella caeni]NYT57273.1 hypothetical protein [Eoetvoesiella caeni]